MSVAVSRSSRRGGRISDFRCRNGSANGSSGKQIVGLERRAKYLIAALSGGEDLVMHLGMTGRFTIQQGAERETPGEYAHGTGANPVHDHVVLHLSDGPRVIYNDPRRFGFMVMMPHAERSEHALFRDLGVEPLGAELTAEYLASRARGKKVNLKAFLMDQRIVAGLGNIYVSEALFRAGLSPNRSASSLADRRGAPTERAKLLVPAIKRRSRARDRRWRIDAARLSRCQRCVGRLSKQVRCLRSRRPRLREARMRRRNSPRHTCGARQFLLPALPALKRGRQRAWLSLKTL